MTRFGYFERYFRVFFLHERSQFDEQPVLDILKRNIFETKNTVAIFWATFVENWARLWKIAPILWKIEQLFVSAHNDLLYQIKELF